MPSGEQSAQGLLEDWPPYDEVLDPINRVFLPRADIATDTLVAGLQELGWEVDDVTAYRTVRAAPPAAPIREAIKAGAFDAVVFTSQLDGAQPGRHRRQAAPVDGRRLHRAGHRQDGGGARPARRRAGARAQSPRRSSRRSRSTAPALRLAARRGRRAGASGRASARPAPAARRAERRDAGFPVARGRGGCARRRRCGGWSRETRLHPADLVLPVFVREGADEPVPIASMPGVVQHSRDSLRKAAARGGRAGARRHHAVRRPARRRTPLGSGADDPDGILNVALRDVRDEVGDDLVVMADLCLDEFTDHGHCGVLDADGPGRQRRHPRAVRLDGAGPGRRRAPTCSGPSGMMDGQVGVVRAALDAAGHHDTVVLAYAAKYASAFYGPFREAVESTLQRRPHDLPAGPGQRRPRRCARCGWTSSEGADIVMVKPALPYLDVLRAVADAVDVPVAAYQVSGEYAMVEAAAAAGMDRPRPGHPGVADRDPAGRRADRADLLGRSRWPRRSAADLLRRALRTPQAGLRTKVHLSGTAQAGSRAGAGLSGGERGVRRSGGGPASISRTILILSPPGRRRSPERRSTPGRSPCG